MQHLPRLLLSVLAITVVATAASVAGPSADPPTQATAPVSAGPSATLVSFDAAPGSPSTTSAIGFFERRTQANDQDAASWALLGQLYLQRGRETSADDWNLAAEDALRRALAIVPDFSAARAALAQALAGQHRFGEAIELAEATFAADERRLDALATIGDAQISIGLIDAAEATYARLAERQPGPGVSARLAHVAELRGDTRAAIALMETAVAEATARDVGGERAAWYRYRLGDLHRHLGDWDAARSAFDDALRHFDELPLALLGLADVALKTGDLTAAEAYLDRADAAVGVGVDSLLARADLAALRSDDELAAGHVATALAHLGQYEPRLAGRDLALVLADNDLQNDRAVLLAEAAVDERPDAFSHDVHAWALYRAGRLTEARAASDRAISVGIAEPSFHLHAALISIALAEPDRAVIELERALEINPDFHPIDAPIARGLLRELTGA